MDKDRVAGSAKKIKGSIKDVVGKAAGDAKLEAKGKADKVEGKRLAKPSRSRRRSDGSHVTETALISGVMPSAAPQRRPRQRYGDWGDHVPMFLLHSVSSSHPKRDKVDLSKSTSRPPSQSCPNGHFL